MPGVLFCLIICEEREVLPPHVSGELRYLFLMADAQIHRVPTRKFYAVALVIDDSSTLDDLREAVTTVEDAERIARRVFGGAHPLTGELERQLQLSRDSLRVAARESGAS